MNVRKIINRPTRVWEEVKSDNAANMYHNHVVGFCLRVFTPGLKDYDALTLKTVS